MKALTSQKGFTLVEMMIVVAIIGVLATIAKFGYDNYQESARQSEAKLTLPAIATALEQFRSEYGSYAADMNAIRFTRKGQNFWYATGWRTGGTPTACGPVWNGNYWPAAQVNAPNGPHPTNYTIATNPGPPALTIGPFTGTRCSSLNAVPRTQFNANSACESQAEKDAILAVGTVPDSLLTTVSGAQNVNFTVRIAGQISSGKACDVWSINQDGAVTQISSGK